MTAGKHTIVGLGELLWDMLSSGKQLGGAPANFAYITNLLGDKGIPASRIGNDSLGDEALQRLTQLGLSADFVQHDPIHPTGTVKVEIDNSGQPRFDILHPVAWDFLDWSEPWHQLASEADAVCFGSLAQRSLSVHDLKLVCITRGSRGSLLISADECSEHPGIKVKIADTVGAGDAFTAAMVHGYLRGTPLAQINETANRVGAWVASQSGATPVPKVVGLSQTLAEIA